MTTHRAARDAVVVGVDGSEPATTAARWAAGLAAVRGLRLRVVHAYGLVGRYVGGGEATVPAEVFESLADDARLVAEAAARAAAAAVPGIRIDAHSCDAPPVDVLTRLSRDAALVVLGRAGRGGLLGALAGSTAVGTASHAVAPVVVVRSRAEGEAPPDDGPVVVGVDGSPLSERAVGYAFEEAAARGAPLVAVHAHADVPEGPRDPLAAGLAGWREKYPDVAVRPVTVREKPRPSLLDRSATARLLVVGSRGLGGFRGLLLGSTSQALMHHARCPVMIVRPTGKERS